MSHLKNKSEILKDAARLLDAKGFYPAVAHCAYYSCYQLLIHIWLHSMGKSETDLVLKRTTYNAGSHETLINEVWEHIKRKNKSDARTFNENIFQLKRLRLSADYADASFGYTQSRKSMELSASITPILKNYC
ncbi:MAG: hypothetical protein LBB79_04195 [Prevotellaceae bacterium]|jgi:hypothetical protein|nr:hypothetical protein [Prevotellaceae bacterium]